MSVSRGKRTFLELLHIVTGVIVTGIFAALAAWAVPNAADSIWAVALASAVVIVLMGIGPLRAARSADAGIGTTDE